MYSRSKAAVRTFTEAAPDQGQLLRHLLHPATMFKVLSAACRSAKDQALSTDECRSAKMKQQSVAYVHDRGGREKQGQAPRWTWGNS